MGSPARVGDYSRCESLAPSLPWPVYSAGDGHAVVIIHELLGLSPEVIQFADKIRQSNYTVYLPVLFGPIPASTKPKQYAAAARCCISREISLFAAGKTSQVVTPLRALAAAVANPHVAVIGMCMSGGFALGVAAQGPTRAAVAAEPALPLAINSAHGSDIGLADKDVADLHSRLASGEVEVFYTRFKNDKKSPSSRLDAFAARIGSCGLTTDPIPSGEGTPFPDSAHSVLAVGPAKYKSQPAQDRLNKTLREVLDFLDRRLSAPPIDEASQPT